MSIAASPVDSPQYNPQTDARIGIQHGGAIGTATSRELPAINWYLLGIAGVYLAWSWFSLPTSIWARCIFACFLIWRMKPDIIIPYALTCFQLKLNFSGRSMFSELETSQVEEFASTLTGFESYAFTIPCVVFAIRCFVASASAANLQRRYFPKTLYGLYLAGAPFVIYAGFASIGKPGWTGGIRLYCMVGLYFYGLLMPGCGRRTLTGIAQGLLMMATTVFCISLFVPFMSRQFFLLMPFPAASMLTVLTSQASLVSGGIIVTGTLSSLVLVRSATFTMAMLWMWSAIAGGLLLTAGTSRVARKAVVTWLTAAALVVSVSFVAFAIVFHNPNKARVTEEDSRWERLNYKLTADRGPIWSGAIKSIFGEPSILGRPNAPYELKINGRTVMWRWSTHNLFLEMLHRLGLVSGPIAIVILLCMVWSARNAITEDSSYGVIVLGIAVIAAVVVGGTTVPYLTGDRQGEHILIAAGMLALVARRARSGGVS